MSFFPENFLRFSNVLKHNFSKQTELNRFRDYWHKKSSQQRETNPSKLCFNNSICFLTVQWWSNWLNYILNWILNGRWVEYTIGDPVYVWWEKEEETSGNHHQTAKNFDFAFNGPGGLLRITESQQRVKHDVSIVAVLEFLSKRPDNNRICVCNKRRVDSCARLYVTTEEVYFKVSTKALVKSPRATRLRNVTTML